MKKSNYINNEKKRYYEASKLLRKYEVGQVSLKVVKEKLSEFVKSMVTYYYDVDNDCVDAIDEIMLQEHQERLLAEISDYENLPKWRQGAVGSGSILYAIFQDDAVLHS